MKFAVLLLLLTWAAVAQQPPSVSAELPATSVRFDFSWPQGIPWAQYSIEVQSNGSTRFDGKPHPDADDANPDPVQKNFTMSAEDRQTIFDLAQKLNYFRGDLDSHVKHIAQTGKKTLAYQSPQVQGSATYNWSQNADVQQITNLFAAIAMTIDYGQKLEFQYRFDKLGMNDRMKELVDLDKSHGVAELHVIAPTLRKIADDPNVMNIARQYAIQLLRGTPLQDGSHARQQ